MQAIAAGPAAGSETGEAKAGGRAGKPGAGGEAPLPVSGVPDFGSTLHSLLATAEGSSTPFASSKTGKEALLRPPGPRPKRKDQDEIGIAPVASGPPLSRAPMPAANLSAQVPASTQRQPIATPARDPEARLESFAASASTAVHLFEPAMVATVKAGAAGRSDESPAGIAVGEEPPKTQSKAEMPEGAGEAIKSGLQGTPDPEAASLALPSDFAPLLPSGSLPSAPEPIGSIGGDSGGLRPSSVAYKGGPSAVQLLSPYRGRSGSQGVPLDQPEAQAIGEEQPGGAAFSANLSLTGESSHRQPPAKGIPPVEAGSEIAASARSGSMENIEGAVPASRSAASGEPRVSGVLGDEALSGRTTVVLPVLAPGEAGAGVRKASATGEAAHKGTASAVAGPATSGGTVGASSAWAPGPASAPLLSDRMGAPAQAVSPGESFRQIDTGGAAPQIIRATAHTVEVGVADPAHGWVEVRAASAAGQIHASLSAASPEAESALRAQLPGMAGYLAEREIGIGSLAVGHGRAGDGGGSPPHPGGEQSGGEQREFAGRQAAASPGSEAANRGERAAEASVSVANGRGWTGLDPPHAISVLA